MIKQKEKSCELVNEKLKLFISYLDISIQSLQQYCSMMRCFCDLISAMY